MNFVVISDMEAFLNLRDTGVLPGLLTSGVTVILHSRLAKNVRLGRHREILDLPCVLVGGDHEIEAIARKLT
ncbi:MAG: hypothetical protein B7Z40_08620 [Bosea sp. 12-68-7]|nr:MAG: hypothetical protein B7Z40_08620 [Bosea sp. 12-68-7]OYW97998.1 MAG: hypothetical protein B7Z14_16115 [Bosea sp. 32-68-6]